MADEAVLRIVLQDSGGAARAPMSAQAQFFAPRQSSTPQPNQFHPDPQPRGGRNSSAAEFKPTRTPTDDFLKIVDGMRGVIGGVFGPVVGSILDVVSAFNNLQKERGKDKYQADILAESKKTTSAVNGVRDAVKSASKPPPPVGETKAAYTGPASFDDVKAAQNAARASAVRGAWEKSQPGYRPPIVPEPSAPPSYARDVVDNSRGMVPYTNPGQVATVPRGGQMVSQAAGGAMTQGPQVVAWGASANAAGAATAGMTGAEMLAAAGPIVAIGAALMVLRDKINEVVIGGIKSVVGGYGKLASGIASADSDPSTAVRAFGDAIGSAGESVAKFVPPLGWMAVAAGEAAKSLAGLMQNLDKTAERYGQYSPEIAQAQAIAEVRQTMGDLRRSRDAAPGLARYIQTRTDMQQKFEDIKIALLTRMLAALNPMLVLLEKIVPNGEGVGNALDTVAANLGGAVGSLYLLTQIAGEISNTMRPGVEDPTTVVLGRPGGQVGAIPAS